MAYDDKRRKRFLSGLQRCLEKTWVEKDRTNGLKDFVELTKADFNEEDYPELSGTIEQADLVSDIRLILEWNTPGGESRSAQLLIMVGKTLGLADPTEKTK
jgi:hypothetical protein